MPSDAFTNMAVDEAILRTVSAGKSPPTLRFYSWAPPAISVGYFQNSLTDVNVEVCRKLGIDVVRRLTGGRAVLHDKELNYSVICPENDPHFPDNILGTYKIISSCLIRGLSYLGLDVSLTPFVKKTGKNAPSACFSSPSHYEITVAGKKLIGSAQRRGEGVFLQHGSILMELDNESLKMVLPGLVRLDTVTSISDYLSVDMTSLISSLVKGFEEELGISLSEGFLSDEEVTLSDRYREEKYSQREWNFSRPSSI